MLAQTVRTTLTLPRDLLAAADDAVRQGQARSRNELVAVALRHELAARKRMAIDAAFAEMARDRDAQGEAATVAEEFAIADWEAFRETEPHL